MSVIEEGEFGEMGSLIKGVLFFGLDDSLPRGALRVIGVVLEILYHLDS
jgi:hypothetical protein